MSSLPVSNPVLAQNIEQTIEDISAQLGHAQAVKGRARSGYYKLTILLGASLVEALLFDYIQVACAKKPELLDNVRTFKTSKEAKRLLKLPKTELGTAKELWICEINKASIDRTKSFKDMNDLSLEIGLISQRLHGSLEYVRKKRNEIHLQTLETSSRQYNMQMLERVAAVFLQLLTKLENI